MITFKEFVDFCNDRACDGCWNMIASSQCISIINDCRNHSLFKAKQEKYFHENYADSVNDFAPEAIHFTLV